MPYKDNEKKLAAQRRSYAKHREQVIAAVHERKRTAYAGTCKHCGGPTVGQSKNDRPDYCAKPACASYQRSAAKLLDENPESVSQSRNR